MDTEMIDKCRIAVSEVIQNSNLPAGTYINSENIVLAVIKAMREPTEKMLMIDAPDMPAGGDVADIWRDMIDAVIND